MLQPILPALDRDSDSIYLIVKGLAGQVVPLSAALCCILLQPISPRSNLFAAVSYCLLSRKPCGSNRLTCCFQNTNARGECPRPVLSQKNHLKSGRLEQALPYPLLGYQRLFPKKGDCQGFFRPQGRTRSRSRGRWVVVATVIGCPCQASRFDAWLVSKSI